MWYIIDNRDVSSWNRFAVTTKMIERAQGPFEEKATAETAANQLNRHLLANESSLLASLATEVKGPYTVVSEEWIKRHGGPYQGNGSVLVVDGSKL